MIKLNAMQQLLEIPKQSMRGLLAVEEPKEYVQPSRMDILQGGLVNLKVGLVLLVSQCQSGYFFIEIAIQIPIAGRIFILKIHSLHFSTQRNMCVYIPSGFSLYLNDQSFKQED